MVFLELAAKIARCVAASAVIAALMPMTGAPAYAQYPYYGYPYRPYPSTYPPAYRGGYAYGYPYAYPRAFYAPYSGRHYGQPSPTWGIPGGHQPSASSHPPY